MKILFLTDNFPPETNAPASRTYEHAIRWVRAGHEVVVITGAPNFPEGKVFSGYRNSLYSATTMDGIHVIRVWTFISANAGFVKRTLDYVSFGVASSVAGIFIRKPDVIVGTSPQFFTAMAACFLGLIKRKPFVFELRDLWPDSIQAVGAMNDSILIRFLRRLEYFMYHRAAKIVSVTHSFREVLTKNGVAAEKIVVVPNGVDTTQFEPGPKPQNLVAQWKLEGKFVAAYVGTIGLAHGLEALLESARKLRHREDIAFVLVGTGAEASRLKEACLAEGLENVRFVGAVDKRTVIEYWKLADVALVLLRDTPLFQHVIPSKMFEAMGMERPIILGVRGESAAILAKAGAGICVAPESADQIASAILTLRDNPDIVQRHAQQGGSFVRAHYNRDALARAMLTELMRTRTD